MFPLGAVCLYVQQAQLPVEGAETVVFPAFSRLQLLGDQECSGVLAPELDVVLPAQEDFAAEGCSWHGQVDSERSVEMWCIYLPCTMSSWQTVEKQIEEKVPFKI